MSRQVHTQLIDLKEPLISDPTVDKIEKTILDSYINEADAGKNQPEDAVYSPPENERNSDQKPAIDFYEINKDLFNNGDQDRDKDPFLFYKQAALKIEKPTTYVKSFCYLPSDPSTFATISIASKFFKKDDLIIKELISLTNYKKLTKLRLKNYIYILRMLTQIDKSQEMYQAVKTRLNHILKVCQMLDICEKKIEQSGYYITKMFYRLTLNQQIYDLDDDDEYMYNQYDNNEYTEFFEESQSLSYEYYSHNLLTEEKKWVVRTQWIEETIAKMKQQPKQASWVAWLESKLDSLSDLDLHINKTTDENKQCQHIFYLHEYLEQQVNLSKKKANHLKHKDGQDEDAEQYLNDKFTEDQQVQTDTQSIYPKLSFKPEDASNSNSSVNNFMNVREKLCLKILARESQTDYFLTVFKRQTFGNEKIYEKRLNTRGRTLDMRRFEFSPNGHYLYVAFVPEKVQGSVKEEESEREEEEKEEEEENKEEKDEEKDEEDKEGEGNEEENQEQAEPEEEEDTSVQRIDLIFPLQAYNKNPLLCKPNSHFLGFHGEKIFLSFQKIELSKDQKEAIIEEEGETKNKDGSFLRIYEHDLHAYDKIKAIDLPFPFTKLTNIDLQTGRFGKNREGYYIIKDQKEIAKVPAEGDNQTRSFMLYKHPREEFKIEVDASLKASEFKEQFCLNDKGDKLLMIYWHSDDFKAARFSLDAKKVPKVFKLDNFDYRQIKQLLLGLEKGTKFISNYEFKIIPVPNDFLIMIKRFKINDEVSFVLGDNILNQTKEAHINDFSFLVHETVTKIFHVKENQMQQVTYSEDWDEEGFSNEGDFEYHQYNYLELANKRSQWITESFKTINREQSFCYPYMFFIYNHDQLYMKDLRLHQNEGLFFMNNYLGIENQMRPITVQCYQNNNSLTLNVPIIASSYQSDQFFLKVNSLVTICQVSEPFSFSNTILEYNMYGFTEEIMSVTYGWSRIITDDQGKLENDVRISMKQNCLVIEKWDKNRVSQRVLITHYDSQIDKKTRDLATGISNTPGILQKSYRLMIFQNKENIQVYSFNLDKHWSTYEFNEELEVILTFPDDEASNPFYDVMVDTLVKGQVDIYVLQQNCQIKRLTAKIPTDSENANQLNFIEYEYIYQVDRAFIDKQKQGLKKINLHQQKGSNKFTYFIANQVLYSNLYNPIDLRAEYFSSDQKMQLGYDIQLNLQRQSDNIQFTNVSLYDGRIYIVEPIDNYNIDEDDLIEKIISLPLLNSRVLPQFHHSQFNHPIVPLINMQDGYTSVFTLNLENTLIYKIFDTYYHSNNASERYPILDILNHQRSHYSRLQQKTNLTPGIVIKYFSGIEEKFPIKDTFINVERFVISQDGHNILITGHRVNINQENKVTIDSGLFVYKIDKQDQRAQIECKQFFPWAQLSEKIDQPIKIKFGISEISQDTQVGQYDEEDYEQNFKKYYTEIIEEMLDDSSPEKQLIIEQSDDEDFNRFRTPAHPPIVQSKKGIFASEPIINITEQQVVLENKMKVSRFQNQKILFEGFDIPYLRSEEFLQELNFIKLPQENQEEQDEGAPKIEEENVYNANMCFQSDQELEMLYYTQEKLSDKDNKRLKKIHSNLNISINESGQIFLINRSSNKLYFFYQDQLQNYKLQKIAATNIKITGAETSQNTLLLWGKQNYQLYDIGKLLGSEYDVQAMRIGMELGYYSGSENLIRLTVKDSIQLKKQMGKKNEATINDDQIEDYLFEIIECYLLNDWVLLKIKEEQESSQINYLKIYDFKKQTVVAYFEYDQLMFSGDKQFIWLPLQDKVYDICNNLSTLFLWPGGQINTAGVDEMDIFNINSDRSIMITHGKLNLAFDMISACHYPVDKIDNSLADTINQQNENESVVIDSKSKVLIKSRETQKQGILRAIEPEENDFRNRQMYLFYNLPNKMSIISRIINIKSSLAKTTISLTKTLKIDESAEILLMKENLLQSLVSYLNKYSITMPQTIQNSAEFMLSFYGDSSSLNNTYLGDSTLKTENQENQETNMNIFQILFSVTNPRKDIIEEILNFVVQSINTPITQHVIFKSFIEFLQSADTSQAFKTYLDSGIMKTSKMKSTLKYAIASTEQGYTISSYVSPIMDEGFQQKFQTGDAKIDVQIQYIFLGDLLQNKGDEILDVLKDDKFTQLMSIPFIKYLVDYQWKTVRSTIEYKSLYPFYALLISYSIYALYYVSYVDFENSIKDTTSFFEIFNYYNLVIIQLGILIYFMGIEAKQFYNDKQEYLNSLWNFSDVLSYSLGFLVIVLDWLNTDSKAVLRPVASINLIIMWIKLFYFLRVYDSTSQLIRMIIQIIMDMKYFLYVLLIGTIAFAGGFYIMQDALTKKITDPNYDKDSKFAGSTPLMAIIYTYRIAMGDFNLDKFDKFDEPLEFYFIWCIFVIGSLFLVIVLLNLLIAIMGASFQNVQNNISNLTIREDLLLLAENEAMFDRSLMFRDAQYLIIISEGKTETTSVQASVDSMLNTLKQEIFRKVGTLDTGFKAQIMETQKDLKKKFQEQEEKQKISFNESEQRHANAMRAQMEESVAKINDTIAEMKAQMGKIEAHGNAQGQKSKVIDQMKEVMDKLNDEQKAMKVNLYKSLKIKKEDIVHVDKEEEGEEAKKHITKK